MALGQNKYSKLGFPQHRQMSFIGMDCCILASASWSHSLLYVGFLGFFFETESNNFNAYSFKNPDHYRAQYNFYLKINSFLLETYIFIIFICTHSCCLVLMSHTVSFYTDVFCITIAQKKTLQQLQLTLEVYSVFNTFLTRHQP